MESGGLCGLIAGEAKKRGMAVRVERTSNGCIVEMVGRGAMREMAVRGLDEKFAPRSEMVVSEDDGTVTFAIRSVITSPTPIEEFVDKRRERAVSIYVSPHPPMVKVVGEDGFNGIVGKLRFLRRLEGENGGVGERREREREREGAGEERRW